MQLWELVTNGARSNPGAVAIRTSRESWTYGELDERSNQMAHLLAARGLRAGHRVGIWCERSARVVAAMQGALRLGAAYVPLDPASPRRRVVGILEDAAIRVVVTTKERARELRREGFFGNFICLPETMDGDEDDWTELCSMPVDLPDPPDGAGSDLAYILFTSGSTGQPKGVCISHDNALAFVRWAAEVVGVTSTDRLSNHAPFHFDLSVFDLYAAFYAGASVHLVPEGVTYAADYLVQWLVDEGITVLYCVPSVLVLAMQRGGLLERRDLALRSVIFAGEPFQPHDVRRLVTAHPALRYFNFYGPTETNVCAYHELDPAALDGVTQIPIGRAASGDTLYALSPSGARTAAGEEGELWVEGPTVMIGYWRRPKTCGAPYATGDIVRLLPGGDYVYVGRRDHLVKVRGFRIELGEIESVLVRHPAVSRAAALVRGSGTDARIVAFLSPTATGRPGLLDLKRHCAESLPRYMIVDDIAWLDALPLTSTGKTDKQRLRAILEGDPSNEHRTTAATHPAVPRN